jgi:hypothetical protein
MTGSTATTGTATIDWRPPAGKTDWFMGNGTTRAERATVWLTVLAAGLVLLTHAALTDLDWAVWQIAVTIVLVIDVIGGVTANGLSTAKRLYHGSLPADAGWFGRIVHRGEAFTALHIHPIVVGLLFGGPWWWGPLWYGFALGGTVIVHAVPIYLQRPVGLGIVTVGVTLSTVLEAPAGYDWFAPALLLKLVLAHAVREEPYRPAGSPTS